LSATALPRLDDLNVLIVDDDADARDLLVTVLTRQGANATAAASVAEAVGKFQNNAPDLIVSDIEMADEDGFSLIKKLREFNRNRTRKIPAVALTAHARSSERLKVLSAGFQTHLAKPIETAEFLAVVASLAELNK
jgi:CheY-like chemotaxis protein